MSKLVAKGAEASLYLEDWYGYQVIRKHRLPKPYRHPLLDTAIRNNRTIREARLLAAARQAGVATPIIFMIDLENATILMEFIKGRRVKELFPELTTKNRQALFREIGSAVAKLHQHNIAHGDLTTSNLLLGNNGVIYFVDFGLATITQNVEDFGTDLHLLRRALSSTHYQHWQKTYGAFKKGYQSTYGKDATVVFRKVAAIESRGRYIVERIR